MCAVKSLAFIQVDGWLCCIYHVVMFQSLVLALLAGTANTHS